MFTTVVPLTGLNAVSTTKFHNTSNNYTRCYAPKTYDVPRWVDNYLNVVAAIILVLSVVANTLVLRGIYLTRYKPFSYILIANIAMAELLGAFLTPFGLHYLTRPWNWVFGKLMCVLIPPAEVCCSIVVSTSLAAFSVYGCLILRKPQKRELKIIVYVSVVISWMWGLGLSIPVAALSKIISYAPLCIGGESISCVVQGNKNDEDLYINIVTFVCRLIIPFVVMIISYGTLLVKIKRLIGRTRDNSQLQETSAHVIALNTHEDQDNQQDSMEEQRPEEETPAVMNNNESPRSKFNELEKKLLRIIYWMVIIYLLCYAPEHFTFLSWRFGWLVIEKKMVFRKHTFVLMAVPKLLHPIFFGWAAGIIQRNFDCCFCE